MAHAVATVAIANVGSASERQQLISKARKKLNGDRVAKRDTACAPAHGVCHKPQWAETGARPLREEFRILKRVKQDL
jgi:hypothetical protein